MGGQARVLSPLQKTGSGEQWVSRILKDHESGRKRNKRLPIRPSQLARSTAELGEAPSCNLDPRAGTRRHADDRGCSSLLGHCPGHLDLLWQGELRLVIWELSSQMRKRRRKEREGSALRVLELRVEGPTRLELPCCGGPMMSFRAELFAAPRTIIFQLLQASKTSSKCDRQPNTRLEQGCEKSTAVPTSHPSWLTPS